MNEHDPLIDYLHKSYYSDRGREEVASHIMSDPEVFDRALRTIHKDKNSDVEYEEYRSWYASQFGDPFKKKEQDEAIQSSDLDSEGSGMPQDGSEVPTILTEPTTSGEQIAAASPDIREGLARLRNSVQPGSDTYDAQIEREVIEAHARRPMREDPVPGGQTIAGRLMEEVRDFSEDFTPGGVIATKTKVGGAVSQASASITKGLTTGGLSFLNDMQATGVKLVGKIAGEDIDDETANTILGAMKGQPMGGTFVDDKTVKAFQGSALAKDMSDYITDTQEKVPELTQSISEVYQKEGAGAAGRVLGYQIAAQIPILALAAVPGGAAAIGASTAGNKSLDLGEQDIESEKALLNATVTGFADFVGERITGGLLRKAGASIKALGKAPAKEAIRKSTTQVIKSFLGTSGTGILLEASEEIGAQLAENIVDIATIDSDVPTKERLTRGLLDAAILGGVTGGAISTAGAAAQAAVDLSGREAVATDGPDGPDRPTDDGPDTTGEPDLSFESVGGVGLDESSAVAIRDDFLSFADTDAEAGQSADQIYDNYLQGMDEGDALREQAATNRREIITLANAKREKEGQVPLPITEDQGAGPAPEASEAQPAVESDPIQQVVDDMAAGRKPEEVIHEDDGQPYADPEIKVSVKAAKRIDALQPGQLPLLVSAARKVRKALGKLDANIPIKIIATQKEAKKEKLSTPDSSSSAVFVYKKKPGTTHIAIDGRRATPAEVFHEGAHAALFAGISTEVNGVRDVNETAVSELSSAILNNLDGADLAYMTEFANRYSDNPEALINEEVVVEAIARMATGDLDIKSVPDSLIQKIVKAAQDMVNRLTGNNELRFDITSEKDAIEFMKRLSGALRTGTEIESMSVSDAGTIISMKLPGKRVSLAERRGVLPTAHLHGSREVVYDENPEVKSSLGRHLGVTKDEIADEDYGQYSRVTSEDDVYIKSSLPGKAQITKDKTGFITPQAMMDIVLQNNPSAGLEGDYLAHVVDHIQKTRERLKRGATTTREVVVAYVSTVASQQARAQSVKAFTDKMGVEQSDVHEIHIEGDNIRPEGAVAWWFMTPEGEAYLQSVDDGSPDPDLQSRMLDVIGAFGLRSKKEAMLTGQPKEGAHNLTNIADLTGRIRENKGEDADAFFRLIGGLNGVAASKTGFVSHFLGMGQRGVIDTRQMAGWINGTPNVTPTNALRGDVLKSSNAAAKKEMSGVVPFSAFMESAPEDRSYLAAEILRRVRMVALKLGYPEDVAGYLGHHLIWDALAGEQDGHKGIYLALQAQASDRAGVADGVVAVAEGTRRVDPADVTVPNPQGRVLVYGDPNGATTDALQGAGLKVDAYTPRTEAWNSKSSPNYVAVSEMKSQWPTVVSIDLDGLPREQKDVVIRDLFSRARTGGVIHVPGVDEKYVEEVLGDGVVYKESRPGNPQLEKVADEVTHSEPSPEKVKSSLDAADIPEYQKVGLRNMPEMAAAIRTARNNDGRVNDKESARAIMITFDVMPSQAVAILETALGRKYRAPKNLMMGATESSWGRAMDRTLAGMERALDRYEGIDGSGRKRKAIRDVRAGIKQMQSIPRWLDFWFGDNLAGLYDFQKNMAQRLTDNMNAHQALELGLSKAAKKTEAIMHYLIGDKADKRSVTSSFRGRLNARRLSIKDFDQFMIAKHIEERYDRVIAKLQANERILLDRMQTLSDEQAKLVDPDQIAKVQRQINRASAKLADQQNKRAAITDKRTEWLVWRDDTLAGYSQEDLDYMGEMFSEFQSTVLHDYVDQLRNNGLIDDKRATFLRNGTDETTGVVFDYYVPMIIKEEAHTDEVLNKKGDVVEEGDPFDKWTTSVVSSASLMQLKGLKGNATFDAEDIHSPFAVAVNRLVSAHKMIEKNEGIKALGRLVVSVGGGNRMKVISSRAVPKLDEFGQIVGTDDYIPQQVKDRSLMYRNDDGKVNYIVFSSSNDPILVGIRMEKMSANSVSTAMIRLIAPTTNLVRMLVTTLSPSFIVNNPVRDFSDAFANLTLEQRPGLRRKFAKNWGKSVAYFTTNWAKEMLTGQHSAPEMHHYFQEMQQQGVQMSWSMMDTSVVSAEDIQSKMDQIDKAMRGGAVATAKKIAKKLIAPMEALSDYSEQITRLAAYAAARQSGYTTQQAAYIAKNVSINFEKKGASPGYRKMSPAFLFLNVGVQGMRKSVALVASKHGRKFLYAYMAFMAANRSLLHGVARGMGDEEDEENLNDYLHNKYYRHNKTLVVNPFDPGNPIKIARPYSALRIAGRLAEDAVDAAFGLMPVTDVVTNRVDDLMVVLDPVGGGAVDNPSNYLPIPALRPIYDIYFGKDWMGRDIYRTAKFSDKIDRLNFNSRTPMLFQQAANSDAMAWLDVNPTTIEYLYDNYFGMGGLKSPKYFAEFVYGNLKGRNEWGDFEMNKVMKFDTIIPTKIEENEKVKMFNFFDMMDRTGPWGESTVGQLTDEQMGYLRDAVGVMRKNELLEDRTIKSQLKAAIERFPRNDWKWTRKIGMSPTEITRERNKELEAIRSGERE